VYKTAEEKGNVAGFSDIFPAFFKKPHIINLAYTMLAYYMPSMITKTDDLLGTLIHDVAHLLRHDIDARLEPHNLTRVKWLALGIIDHQGPMTQSDLAAEMELGAASVGRLVDRLVERGFVIRSQHPEDRRSYRLSLSKTAEALLKELDGTAAQLRQDTLHALSDAEIQSLNSGLLKLKNNLKARALVASVVLFVSAQKLSSPLQAFSDYVPAI
jgi:DNA-binding MarR family transcriptional regulator